jgi:[ribosomal protein S18]-alanine N-acetyltransferase
VKALILKPLDAALLPAAVALDQLCLGGFWSLASYQQELDRKSAILLGLTPMPGLDHPTLLAMAAGWQILEELHITLLAVHPYYRRQGWGQLLIQSLLSLAGQQKLERATLEVRASNQAALGLYTQLGFQIAGRRRDYYADPREDGLILWCGNIDQPAFQEALAHAQQQSLATLNAAGWQILNQLGQEIN